MTQPDSLLQGSAFWQKASLLVSFSDATSVLFMLFEQIP